MVEKSVNNSSLGEFYTPRHISKALKDVTKETLGDDFTSKFLIWDCCCGEFALTKELDIEDDSNLYCSTLRGVDIRKNRREKGTKFVYDFLNDDCDKLVDYAEREFGEYKMPKSLLDELNNPNGKPILFYINPPYANNSVYGVNSETRGKDFNTSKVQELMGGFGVAKTQLLANFLYRILLMKRVYANKNIYISIIMPVKYLSLYSYKSFRLDFFKDFKLANGILFSSDEFDNLSGEFSIANLVFTPNLDNSYCTEFNLRYFSTADNDFTFIKDKLVYNSDSCDKHCNGYLLNYKNIGDTIAPFVMSSGKCLLANDSDLPYNENSLGYYFCYTTTVSGLLNKLGIVSFPFSQGGNFEINKSNFRDILTNFAVREIAVTLFRKTDFADNEFLEPNFNSGAYKLLQSNALLVSLFASNTHYIGCTYNGKRYYNKFIHSKQLYEKLLSSKVSSDVLNNCDLFISDELEKDLKSGYVLKTGLEFYNKLESAFELAYSCKERFYEEHSEYQSNLDDLGWYQVKFILKEYFPDVYKDIRLSYREYIKDLVDYIFEAGFLRR